LTGIAWVFAGLLFAPSGWANDNGNNGAPRIAIIVDDLGHNLREGKRAIALPGAVAYAILPHTRFSVTLANMAHDYKKEVMLHFPMTSILADKDPGPGKIESVMPALEIALTLSYNLETVPHVTGINNHMGSQLTQERDTMDALMQALQQHGDLFFVDSLTTPHSVATVSAQQHNIPYLRRDVFLDSRPNEAFIEKQFNHLLNLARRNGQAVAIGHPYRETLAVLERRLPQLSTSDITLVSPSDLIAANASESGP